jgi:predicted translin family RNA/ssDNA-binding protein
MNSKLTNDIDDFKKKLETFSQNVQKLKEKFAKFTPMKI